MQQRMKLLICSATLVIMCQGCTLKPALEDTPNKIGSNTYSYEELKQLGNKEYEASNLNEYLLSETLYEVAEKEEIKEADKISKEYYKKNKITDKKEKETYYKQTVSNLVLQKEYDKQLDKSKGYKENLEKALSKENETTIVLQVLITVPEEVETIGKELGKEFKGTKKDQDYVDFMLMYGLEDGYKGKKKANPLLKGKIIADLMPLNDYTGGGIFPEVLESKINTINKIGKDNYVGYMIPMKKVKMTEEEVKEAYREQALIDADFLQTKEMLINIDKEYEKIKFSEKATKAISNNWE